MALVAIVLLSLVPIPSGEAQEAGPAWWNPDWPFRVIVDGQAQAKVPVVGSGQTDLLAYELSFEDALAKAGWPKSLVSPPDPQSIVVVPYSSLGTGATPGAPMAYRLSDPIVQTGRCDNSTTARCLVVWTRVPTASGYGIYWAPTGWDLDAPRPAGEPRMVGSIMGHEHWFFLDGYSRVPLEVLVSPAGGRIEVEAFTAEGRTSIFGSGSSSECSTSNDVLSCRVPPGTLRVLSNEPTVAVAAEVSGAGLSLTPNIQLALGPGGQAGGELRTILPGGTWSSIPKLLVWAHEGSCQTSRCTVSVSPGPATPLQVGSSFPVVQDLPKVSDPTPILVQAPSGQAVHAAIRGVGFAAVDARDAAGEVTVLPVSGTATLTAAGSTVADLNDLSEGSVIKEDLAIDPPYRPLALGPSTGTLEVRGDDPVQAYAGSLELTGGAYHAPIPASPKLVVPDGARLVAISPGMGAATQTGRVTFESGREPVTSLLRLSSEGSRELVRAGKGATTLYLESIAPLGFLVVSPAPSKTTDAPGLIAQPLSVFHPGLVELKSAGYLAKAFAIGIDPQSAFAGAGSVVRFNLTLENLARAAGGARPGLTIGLDVQPQGLAAELGVEATIGATSVELPGGESEPLRVPFNLRVPEGVADVVLEVLIRATVIQDTRIVGAAAARVSVVTIRDFELTFEDGSNRQVQTAEPGGRNVFGLVVRNTGTVPLDVRLAADRLGGEGFEVCLSRQGSTSCGETAVLEGIEPGRNALASLRVLSPDKDDEDRIDLLVRGELTTGTGPVRSVDATVFLNVPVVASLRPGVSGLSLAPGESRVINVTVENQGVQATGILSAVSAAGLLNASLLDPDSGQATDTLEQLLGPRGTTAGTWRVAMRVSVSPEAPPGLTSEVRLELTLQPTGGLPPFRTSATVPVRVLRVLTTEPLEAPPLGAGLERVVELAVRLDSLKGSQVHLRLVDAPSRWDIETPTNLTFDENGRAILRFSILPPVGTPAGTYDATFEVLDPLGPGGDLQVRIPIVSGGNARITLPSGEAVALGDHLVLQAVVENVGNAPLEGRLELIGEIEGLTLTTRPFGPLSPANATRVPVTLTVSEPLEAMVGLRILDGGRDAGNATVSLIAEAAPLSLGAVRIPAGSPDRGDLYPVTVTINNGGNVPVRNLTLALREGERTIASTTLERVRAAAQVPVTIEWVPDEDTDLADLTVVLDPEGRILQDKADDTIRLEERSDAPLPGPLLLLLVSLILPARLRALWRLTSPRERALIIGGLVLLLVLVPLLFIPTLQLTRAPAVSGAPGTIVDSDGDGVSDAAEITRYGTLHLPSDPRSQDSDEDGLPDGWEVEHARFDPLYRTWRPDPARADAGEDPDEDALGNLAEYRNGTDPHLADTDGDGFPDGWEVRSRLDPTTPNEGGADCDGDGLSNREEFERGTLACVRDSDADGIPDDGELTGRWAVAGRTIEFAPTDPAQLSTGASGAPDGWLLFFGLDPSSAVHRTGDPDGDELSTFDEWRFTLGAGRTDPEGWSGGLSPTTGDTDGDGLPDGWEVRVGLDPLDPTDGGSDTDGDGLSNGLEHAAGTNPTLADTDGDGLSDGTEVQGWTIRVKGEDVHVRSNPLIRDTDGDGIPDRGEKDGLFEGREFPPTNPLSGDTDGDGLSDGVEITALPPPLLLDPTAADTDGDGLLDGEEWDLWTSMVAKAATDPDYASLVRTESRRTDLNLTEVLGPAGDLDGDGVPNILDPNADDPGGLPATQSDGIDDGEEVFPPSRAGHLLPKSDPSLRDSDGDGLPDGWEVRHTRFDARAGIWLLDPLKADSDGNGVNDADEDMETGCFGDPSVVGDGPPWWDATLPNRLELEQGTDPLACDTDSDGLPDGWELAAQTRAQSAGLSLTLNPLNVDTDGDGTPDGAEVSPGSAPPPKAKTWVGDPLCEADGVEEGGKTLCLWRWSQDTPLASVLSDLLHVVDLRGTCETSRCTVVTVLNLTSEVTFRTDPATADSDGDGFPDAWEVLHRLDPGDAAVPEPLSDADKDGLTIAQELELGTDPNLKDTDRGGLDDSVDINPLDPSDDKGDCDFDGIDDATEARGGLTRPGEPDSDGDGLVDRAFSRDNCRTAAGERLPTLGVDVIGVADPADPNRVLGESRHATDPNKWDSDGDGLPDGWEVRFGLNPRSQDSPQADQDGDGMGLRDEYQLGRPAWWVEAEHGAWWFGADPTRASSRDLDGDGLDDALFDPEPLSALNDCSLPPGWSPPAAWGGTRCLSARPATPTETASLVRGLGELAWAHVLQGTGSPEASRGSPTEAPRQVVRAESVSHTPASLDTAEPFNVTVELCVVSGSTCTKPAGPKPLVGIYAVTRGEGAQPRPKADPLLCVVEADANWRAHGPCSFAPGERTLPAAGKDLVLALHKHGVLEPSGSWRVEPGDLEPGDTIRLAAWPLPTETPSTLLVAATTPRTLEVTPVGRAVIALLGDPILESGSTATLRLQLTDAAGHHLGGRALRASWNGSHPQSLNTGPTGATTFTVEAPRVGDPTTVPLVASFRTAGVLTGVETTFDVPVRIPSDLNATALGGTAPGTLPVGVQLTDGKGRPLGNRTVTATAKLPGLSETASATAVTDVFGEAKLQVPLPAGVNPGQAALDVAFAGDERAGPAGWKGLADVRVRPVISLEAPSEARLTDGVTAVVGLRLPNGAPVTPAPGEALSLSVQLGSQRVERTLTNAPTGGRVVVNFPAGPELGLGTQDLVAGLSGGRFNEAGSNKTTVTVRTAVSATVTPLVLGTGVDNEVVVQLRDSLGRPLAGPSVSLELLGTSRTGSADGSGNARILLPVALNAPRGEQTLHLEVAGSDRSLPLERDLAVTVRLGTDFELPGELSGSVLSFSIPGRLVTATGAPVPEAVVTIEALGSRELVSGPDGRFEFRGAPPEGTRPGSYPVRLVYAGSETLAPAVATGELVLRRPVNLSLEQPAPAAIGSLARITGVVTSQGEPVEGSRVLVRLGNASFEGVTGPGGRFTLTFPIQADTPTSVQTVVAFPPQGPYASAETPVLVQVVQAVELTATQRASGSGTTLSVQAATADGKPLAGRRVVVALPGSLVQLETDEAGVARYHLAPGTLSEGTTVEFLFQGTSTEGSASTALEVQAATTTGPGRPIGAALVALILVLEAYVLYRVIRRRRVLDRMLDAVQDLESRLLAGDELRASVVQAFRQIRAALESVGVKEAAHETHRHYLARTFQQLGRPSPQLESFLDLVDRAQYDPKPLDHSDRTSALRLSRSLIEVLEETLPRRRSLA